MTDQERFPIPATVHRVKEEIRRSRFITTVGHAPTVEAAREFIEEVRQEFADASHNCWAYVAGPPGSTAQVGLSDDGEPHGTAGRPMLMVLSHSGVGEIVAVVTRYFGGTLLGKGGLVKAYSGGVKYALEDLPVQEKVSKSKLAVIIDYSNLTLFRRMLPDFEIETLGEEFEADVTVFIEIPDEHLESFRSAVIDLTHGQALFESQS